MPEFVALGDPHASDVRMCARVSQIVRVETILAAIDHLATVCSAIERVVADEPKDARGSKTGTYLVTSTHFPRDCKCGGGPLEQEPGNTRPGLAGRASRARSDA